MTKGEEVGGTDPGGSSREEGVYNLVVGSLEVLSIPLHPLAPKSHALYPMTSLLVGKSDSERF